MPESLNLHYYLFRLNKEFKNVSTHTKYPTKLLLQPPGLLCEEDCWIVNELRLQYNISAA